MNIGIVIDGALTNLEQFQFNYGSKFYYEKEMILKNPKESSVKKIYHKHGNYLKSNQKEKTFWDCYLEFYLLKETPRPFAPEVILKLHEHGNHIYLFCTRTYFSAMMEKEKVMHLTKLWLMEYGIYFDFLIFSDMINMSLMRKYGIQLFLGHLPDHVFSISSQIPVVCFQAKYNELCRGENIFRVYSWYDFYGKLDEILKTELEHQEVL